MSRARVFRIVRLDHLRQHREPKWLIDGDEREDHRTMFRTWTERNREQMEWSPWACDVYVLFASVVGQDETKRPNLAAQVLTELGEIATGYGLGRATTVEVWRAIAGQLIALPDRDKKQMRAIRELLAIAHPAQ